MIPGLPRRLATAGVVLPFLVLAIYAGARWLALVLALLAVCGARELTRIHRSKGRITPWWLPAAGAVLLIATQARLTPIALPAALVAITTSAMIVELFRRNGSMLGGFPLVLLSSIYLGLLPAFLLGYYHLGSGDIARPWPVYWVLILIFACDTAAYLVGSRFGRHKLWPRVSPSKSWEGSVAGVVTSVALAVALGRMVPGLTPQSQIVAGLLVGVFGQIGDLGESLMKREAEVKDSGTTFPGHGGVLDRLDSVVLTVPILYYWLLWSLRTKG